MAEPIVPLPAQTGTSQWGPLADWIQRVIATLIDSAIIVVGYIAVAIVGVILGAISDTLGGIFALVGYLVLTAATFYIYYMNGARGASPGKRLTGLKIVKIADGQVLGGGMGILRGLLHFIDGVCFIGYLFPLWDPQRQTFTDKILSTVVLKDQPKESFGSAIFKL